MLCQWFKPELSRIVFIRHAESKWNVLRKVQGNLADPTITLTPAGQLSVRPALAALPKPHTLIVSPLIRCKQTAEAWFDTSFEQIPITTKQEPNLLEINAGIYEGRNIDELKNDPLWKLWMNDPISFPGFPEGEKLEDFSRRVLQSAATLCMDHADSNQRVCVITHGVVMRVLKCFIADQGLEHLWTHQVTNLERIHLSEEQILKFRAFHMQCSMNADKLSGRCS